ncbi:AAA family ATPase [Lentibacillus cibarius]|uniref:AAA family ATPase n=1 Tax=Lentibacillus cibarius TaxID=2583219 RepID=A0A549YF54_9BACI|nr:sigma 54-interacting transcriptional regulator [Lentibacillus cibarius]TRM10513.1 AAA family ATPase [Lentibacillus cibarius]
MNNQLVTNNTIEITSETLKRVLDYSTDEIYIIDRNHKIVYVNKVCERHYGVDPSTIIGRDNKELFDEGYWGPSITPIVFEKKQPVHIIQDTYLGAKLMTTAIPVLKDDEIEFVIFTSQEIHHYRMMEKPTTILNQEKNAPGKHPTFIANSPEMKKTLKFCQKIAVVNSTVLIKGESGTGKSILANYIHQLSTKRDGPFFTISCASIPEELLESELFGYVPGAFTGAKKSGKQGLIELADKGTLFLDEIGEMPLHLQAKLLHVLQEKEFLPVGGERMKQADIRIIAATNRNLEEMVEQKLFREDLFYRLNVIDINLPPLRKRKEDITPLIYHFLYKFNSMYNLESTIAKDCLDLLTAYNWPGNIRQLENVMERLVVTCDDIIQMEDIPDLIKHNSKVNATAANSNTLDSAVEDVKKTMVRTSFKKYKSSRKVAEDLDISQSKASKLIRQYCGDLRGDTED